MKTPILILCVLMSFASFGQETDEYVETVTATVVQKKAYNKAGKEMKGAGDFFLKIKGEELLFIKLSSSQVAADELTPLLDKKAKFKIIRRNGLWDTDNPEVQSRIGPYASLIAIL